MNYIPFDLAIVIVLLKFTNIQPNNGVISDQLKNVFEKENISDVIVTFRHHPSEILSKISQQTKSVTDRGEKLRILSDELESLAKSSQINILKKLGKKCCFSYSLDPDQDKQNEDVYVEPPNNKVAYNDTISDKEITQASVYSWAVFIGTDEYGWFDPNKMGEVPRDITGHGTGCLGHITGKFGLGIAPSTKWMACNYVDDGWRYRTDWVVECFQFMLCPTDHIGNNKNCSRAPRVISNSYNTVPGESNEFFREITKPDICAPAHMVMTAHYENGDDFIDVATGTSLSTPIVGGVIAMMVQKNPKLSQEGVKKIIFNSTTLAVIDEPKTCGDTPDDQIPNNRIGRGVVNALKAIRNVPEP
ncbi:unnamed protein product [Allacma fusca]|uniref:Peptidase S8/S53 domain-containing protein n=1 Tax=Allacma fusca TaxID=39272 RepID=A0A8J2L1U4_9HEXA|nr:unnamed protein product [Allacma fusca]